MMALHLMGLDSQGDVPTPIMGHVEHHVLCESQWHQTVVFKPRTDFKIRASLRLPE